MKNPVTRARSSTAQVEIVLNWAKAECRMAMIAPALEEPPFAVLEPANPGPLVFASPHSGDHYPADMGACGVSETSLRSAEDAYMDRLIAPGADHGASLLLARYGRAYLDLNREPDEIDPLLARDAQGLQPSPRTAAGYGVTPRLTGDGKRLYDRRLSLAEIEARVERVHRPYHAELARLMQAARARHGAAVLVDWHSMPARATGGPTGAEVVIGDRHGASCATALTRRLTALFEALGWRVQLNRPYAGGYSTQAWARPAEGYHAIQIELSRALYLDQATLKPNLGWTRAETGVRRVIEALCREVRGLAGAT